MPGEFNWASILYRLTKGWSPKQFGGGQTLANQLYFLNRYGPGAFGYWRPPTKEMVDPKGGFKPAQGTWFGVEVPQANAIRQYMAWYDSFRKAGGKHDDALRAFMTQNQRGQFGGTKFNYQFQGLPYYQNRYFENYTPAGFNPFEQKRYNGAALLQQAGGNLEKARDLARAAIAGTSGEAPSAAGGMGVVAPSVAIGESAPGAPGAPGGAGGAGAPQAGQANITNFLPGLEAAGPTFQSAMGGGGQSGSYMGSGGLPSGVTELLDDQAYRNLRSYYGSNPQSLSDIMAYGRGTGAFAWGGAPAGLFDPTVSWRTNYISAPRNMSERMDDLAINYLKPLPAPPTTPGGGGGPGRNRRNPIPLPI